MHRTDWLAPLDIMMLFSLMAVEWFPMGGNEFCLCFQNKIRRRTNVLLGLNAGYKIQEQILFIRVVCSLLQ